MERIDFVQTEAITGTWHRLCCCGLPEDCNVRIIANAAEHYSARWRCALHRPVGIALAKCPGIHFVHFGPGTKSRFPRDVFALGNSPVLSSWRVRYVEKNARVFIRHRSGNCSFFNSDLGLFPIYRGWTGRRPPRRRPWPRGWAMRAIAACLRKQGQARGAGRRKLPHIPGNLSKTSSEGCVWRIETSLPQQGSVGRTRRRKLS
jgi:hypothetical protein